MLRHVAAEPNLQALFEYWDRKRAGEAMPNRNIIDPIEIGPKLLPGIVLYEGIQPGERVRYRLAGTEIANQFGRDPTGKYLDDILSGSYHEYVVSLIHNVCLHSAVVYSESAFRWNDGGFQRTRRLMLPLSWRGNCPGLVLSAQTFGPLIDPSAPPLTLIHRPGTIEELVHEESPIGMVRSKRQAVS
jgi:hypothetical protein